MQLFYTQAGKLCQTHIDDGVRLQLIKVETFFKGTLSIRRSLSSADDVYHLINVIAGNDESLKDVGAFLCLTQFKLCATNGYIVAMFYEMMYTLFE